MALSSLRSRELVVLIAGFSGIIVLIEYYISIPILSEISSTLKMWAVLIAAFAWGVGFFRKLQLTAIKVQTKASDMWLSVYGAALTLVMIFFGLVYGTGSGGSYDWLFTNVLMPVRTTTVALTCPFIFSAGFRAFRARNRDATLFLLAGIFILFYNAPISEVIWSGFPVIGKWIMNVPQASVGRAIFITTGLGIAGYGIRYLAGLEQRATEGVSA